MYKIQPYKWSFALLCGTILLWSAPAQAKISLELTQASYGAISVLIHTDADGMPSRQLQQALAVARQDLSTNKKIQIQTRKQGDTDYVVTVKTGKDQRVCVQVSSPYSQRQSASIPKSCYKLSKTNHRRVGHSIADKIYTMVLGKPSVFLKKIVYVAETANSKSKSYALTWSDYDGANAQVILRSPEPIMSPSFSPDGSQVAYVSFEHKKAEIFVQDLHKATRYVLSGEPGVNAAPCWSPDGSKIAYVLSITGMTKIYVYDFRSKQRMIIAPGVSIDTEPFWNKDAKSILFASNRSGSVQIHRYDLNNGQVTQLTHQGSYNVSPSLGESENTLVYLTRLEHKLQVVSLQLDTGVLSWIGSGTFDDTPKIDTHSGVVLYSKGVGEQRNLAMVSTDGAMRTGIQLQGSAKHPAWVPEQAV